MKQLTRKFGSLLARKSGLQRSFSTPQSLSGHQILEALLTVANEADTKFTPEMLQEFWKPFDGNYSRFVRDISARFGLNEMPLYDLHEPIEGYNRHHYLLKKNLTRLLPSLTLFDPQLLDRTKEEDELLVVSYHIWYATGSSRYYFDSDSQSSDVRTRLYEKYLRMRGVRERSEIEEEVATILAPFQISARAMPLEILTSQPRDLFAYNQRLFTLGRKRENFAASSGAWVDIVWAFGLYTKWPEPIGYVLLNKDLEDKAKLFLPAH